jgi:hypothetical protein
LQFLTRSANIPFCVDDDLLLASIDEQEPEQMRTVVECLADSKSMMRFMPDGEIE